MVARVQAIRRVVGVVATADAGADASSIVRLAERMGASLQLLAALPERGLPGGRAIARLRAELLAVPSRRPSTVQLTGRRLAIEAAHAATDPVHHLLVLGRHAALLPGLLDDVLFRARVPVLSMGTSGGGGGPVVAAIDGDERSASVVVRALEFARRLGRSVVAVTVDAPDGSAAVNLLAPRMARASDLLRRMSEAHGQLPIRLEARVGPVGAAIAEAAVALDAVAVVVGRRTGSAGGAHAGAVLADWHGPTLLVPI